MSDKAVFLKPNVVAEPLIARWYAWPHLISPATAALNILERHLEIMESYILAPHIHATSIRNPKLLGGPFMNYPTNRVQDIKNLRNRILTEQDDLLNMAAAIKNLYSLLSQEADGHALTPLYNKVPDVLKGYVELFYDVDNHASFRFFESLLYKSKFYNESFQSLFIYLIEEDDRPFVLSTPRLDAENGIHLSIPFCSIAIDELFKMVRVPNSYLRIKEMLGIGEEQEEVFKELFTEVTSAPYNKFRGHGAVSRYFGHACVLLEAEDVSILLDPVISYGYDTKLSRYTYADLPDVIDCVIITHNHQDHVLVETMLQLRHKIKRIIVPRNGTGKLQDPNLKIMFQALGFENVYEMDEFETLEFSGCKLTGIPFLGEHADLEIRTKLCYHINLKGLKILFAADSCNIEPALYNHVHQVTGDVDVLYLGMECDGAPLSWLYGPLIPQPLSRDRDHSRRLAGSNYLQGMGLVNTFNPKEVYVYAMGQEPWLNHIMAIKYTDDSNPIVASNRLIEECLQRGIKSERLYSEKILTYN